MEIIVILVAIVGAIITIARITHRRREQKEKSMSEIIESKAEILELISQFQELHSKLKAKFNDKYLATLKKELDVDQYDLLKAKLTMLIDVHKKMAEFEQEKLLPALTKEVMGSRQDDFQSGLAIIENSYHDNIMRAKQLLSSRVVGGTYLPIDEALS